MAFSLKALLYVFALLASCLGLFGLWGFGVWALVLGTWAVRFGLAKIAWSEYVAIWLLVLLGIVLVLPDYLATRRTRTRPPTYNLMKQVVLSIHRYADTSGRMPPPYTVGDDGTRLHSWRTLLWPCIEGYASDVSLDMSKPWDDPVNQAQSPTAEPWQSLRFDSFNPQSRHTSFLAVVDDETVWPEDRRITSRDITDGQSNTIAFIEVAGTETDFMEPRDLSLDQAVDLLAGNGVEEWETSQNEYFFRRIYRNKGARRYRIVAFMDGTVGALAAVDRATARALLTRSGGEPIPESITNPARRSIRTRELARVEFRWGRLWSVCFFVVLVALPAFAPRVRVHAQGPANADGVE